MSLLIEKRGYKVAALPPGPVVGKCVNCGQLIHKAHLSLIYRDHAWHDVHQWCRHTGWIEGK